MKIMRKDDVRASFTIEAAVIVPIILAVIFLLLQMILYLHDTVWTEVWLSGQAWNVRWSQENESDDENGVGMGEVPRLAVLRCGDRRLVEHSRSVRAEALFQIHLFPRFVTVIFETQPDEVSRQVTEKIVDTPQFLKIVGAILEEGEEK